MIAVIADDLTGAAEIGGIGLNYNLSVEISTTVNADAKADLLIINTDARSKNEHEAVAAVSQVCRELKKLQPVFIYKKIDSILRGHVLAEITAELAELDLPAALIIPANPALNRTLVNRTYFINKIPVHQTSFTHDPEFPILNADVLHMLKADENQVTVLQPHETLPDTGICVGEVEHENDLALWAKQINYKILLAGASGFFSALLSNSTVYKKSLLAEHQAVTGTILYVSGTTYQDSVNLIKEIHNQGGPVSYMPLGTLPAAESETWWLAEWSKHIALLLEQQGKAIIAINQETAIYAPVSAVELRKKTAAVVKQVFQLTKVDELIIEGGSTAAAILNDLKIKTIYPIEELARGVIRNKAVYHQNLNLTLKPGSYKWNPTFWKF